jgi:hypothetical protein
MGQLHDRCCHHPFAPTEAFQADALPGERFQSEMQAGTAAGRQLTEEGSGRAWGLLSFAPFLVPFRERAKLFQAVVAQVGGVLVTVLTAAGSQRPCVPTLACMHWASALVCSWSEQVALCCAGA